MMPIPLYSSILLYFLLAISHISTCIEASQHQFDTSKPKHVVVGAAKETQNQHRDRRSLNDEEEDKPFWANRGKRFLSSNKNDEDSEISKETIPIPDETHLRYVDKNSRYEAPFWGNRGRRYSKENLDEVFAHAGFAWPSSDRRELFTDYNVGKNLQDSREKNSCLEDRAFKQNERKIDHFIKHNGVPTGIRDENSPLFWGNRGSRSSKENWQDDSEENPFWGNRGRRDDSLPFWGVRGRRDDEPPFWGARGRRDEGTPFWGARGKKTIKNPLWGDRGKISEEDVTDYLLDALKNINSEMQTMPRAKRSIHQLIPQDGESNQQNTKILSFWQDRGRNSALKYLFNNKELPKVRQNRLTHYNTGTTLKDYNGSKSIRQDRLYAEQPYYIIVDRSSRSVAVEDDPYFISRGKKKTINEEFAKAARGRRGVIEEIVRNVQSDPYFAVRGKKDGTEQDNILEHHPDMKDRFDELYRARELICSAIMLTNPDKEVRRDKREMSDRDRNRRAILKKLAARLQNDPYFVSRGKKNLDLDVDENKLEKFVRQVNEMC